MLFCSVRGQKTHYRITNFYFAWSGKLRSMSLFISTLFETTRVKSIMHDGAEL